MYKNILLINLICILFSNISYSNIEIKARTAILQDFYQVKSYTKKILIDQFIPPQ